MIFLMCFNKRKNNMSNGYKDIVNNFKEKKHMICMIPSEYDENEFSDDFFLKYKENISVIEEKGFLKYIFIILNWYKFIKEFCRLKRKYNINKIFIYPDNRIIYPLLSFFMNKIKIICWVHDPSLHLGETINAKLNRFLNRKTLFKKVTHFIVSYKSAENELYNNYNIDKRKISSIFLPRLSSMEFEDILTTSIPTRYDFIFFGRIEEYKGVDLLIKTFKNNELKNIKLLIVGDGQKSQYIKEKIKTLHNVFFINKYVSDRRLAEYIMQSKYVILPYKTATGSQTIQIANYYNKLVLATKVGCFPEYIIDGENGVYIEEYTEEAMKKAILKIINYKYNKNRIKKSLGRFNIKKISNDVYKIIKMV